MSQFTRDASKRDGLHTRCKDCRHSTETKRDRPRTQKQRLTQEQRQTALIVQVAKDRLAEMFPTQFARLVLSERRRVHFFGQNNDQERLVS